MKFWWVNANIKACAALASWAAYRQTSAPIVVASTGRSGSTMLAHAIMNTLFTRRWGVATSPRFVFFPAFHRHTLQLRPGGVHKTHLLGDAFSAAPKCIFIFDSPTVSHASFERCCRKYGPRWGRTHLANLESPFDLGSTETADDILNFQQQMTTWKQRPNTCIVKFDCVWSQVAKLSEFLNLELQLPPRAQRRTDGNQHLRRGNAPELESLYQDSPDFIVT